MVSALSLAGSSPVRAIKTSDIQPTTLLALSVLFRVSFGTKNTHTDAFIICVQIRLATHSCSRHPRRSRRRRNRHESIWHECWRRHAQRCDAGRHRARIRQGAVRQRYASCVRAVNDGTAVHERWERRNETVGTWDAKIGPPLCDLVAQRRRRRRLHHFHFVARLHIG